MWEEYSVEHNNPAESIPTRHEGNIERMSTVKSRTVNFLQCVTLC